MVLTDQQSKPFSYQQFTLKVILKQNKRSQHWVLDAHLLHLLHTSS